MRAFIKILFITTFFTFTYTSCKNEKSKHLEIKTTVEVEKKTEIQNPKLIKGENYYKQYCMACHQKDGMGVPSLNPPLSGTDWVLGNKKRLIDVVLNGLSEEIEIDGEVYSNAMGSFAALSNSEIALVLTFIRQSFGNDAQAITEEEVASVRSVSINN